jgi:hypothetical protein
VSPLVRKSHGRRIGEDASRGDGTGHQAVGCSDPRGNPVREPDRDFQQYLSRVRGAVAEMAAQVTGRERLLTGARSRCKALFVAATSWA